jgi:hypothetical protein
MSAIATAIVGGAVIGGVLSSNAAENAAETQANAATGASQASLQATRETNALQQQMYQQNLANQSPWLQSGGLALSALTGGLGLGQVYGAGGQPDGRMQIPQTPPRSQALSAPSGSNLGQTGGGAWMGSESPDSGRAFAMGGGGGGAAGMWRGQTPPPRSGLIGTVANLVGGAAGAGQPQPAGSGLIPAGAGQVQNYGASPEAMAAAGRQYAGNGGRFTETFRPSDIYTDPSYQWRTEQGRRQLEASAAARGMTGSGQNLRDITDYGQQAGSQEYGAAYDRFMNNQSTLYNRLAGLAGVGQTTAGTLGAAGQQTAANIGQNTMAGIGASNSALIGGANAQAAGQVGSANAWGSAIGGGINNYMGWQYLNGKMTPPVTAAPVTTGVS